MLNETPGNDAIAIVPISKELGLPEEWRRPRFFVVVVAPPIVRGRGSCLEEESKRLGKSNSD